MADLSNVQFDPQNPDALFSPDQWLNQFSNFNSKPLPWPSTYAGYPTDAMGNPIGGGPSQQMQAPMPAAPQSTPGTTLNSMPAGAGSGGQANYSNLGRWGPAVSQLENTYLATPGGQAAANNPNAALINYIRSQNQGIAGNPSNLNQGGFGSGNNVMSGGAQGQIALNLGQIQQLQRQGGQAAPQQAAPAAPGGLTYPQILALLANPGKVTTPGANVPVGPSAQPGGGVNNAFLGQAQGRPGKNQNFLSALGAIQGRG